VLHKVSIYHNILWSKYKGVVFSKVYSRSVGGGINVSFIQIAETEQQRVALGNIDLSYHKYPYRLLFPGSFDSVPVGRRILALMRDVLKNPSDLVVIPGYEHIEYWGMLLVCMLLRRKRAVFCDSTINDRPRSYLLRELAKGFFFRRCDGFFCYGIRSKDYLLSYGVNEKRIIFRYQAAALPHDYDRNEVLKEYRAIPSGERESPTFLYVGRLSGEKGLEDLLDGFKTVHARVPTAKLNLVGAGSLKQKLIDRAKALGLETSVSFLGAMGMDEIARLFMRSTALVLPSHSEPWGLVVNESLSYGCPVVVSDACGCVPELVLNGITGYSFPVGDVRALTDALLDVRRLSADRVALAERCMDIIAGYSPDVAASQILDGCQRMLEAT
jgi:glycosyltransferase involved in cell wall biosynthesis